MRNPTEIIDKRTFKLADCFIRAEFTGKPIDTTGNDYKELFRLIGSITVNFSIYEKIIMEKSLHEGFSVTDMEKAWNDEEEFKKYQNSRFSKKSLWVKIEQLNISNDIKDVYHQLRYERNELSHSLATYMPYIHMMDIETTVEKLKEYEGYLNIACEFATMLRTDLRLPSSNCDYDDLMISFILDPYNNTETAVNLYKELLDTRQSIIENTSLGSYW